MTYRLRRPILAALTVLWALPASAAKEFTAGWTGTGHGDDVTCVTFSPDGTRALSGSQDKTVRLWDVAKGQTLKIFAGHESPVTTVAFSTDGVTALSVSDELSFRSWDIATGKPVLVYPGHGVFIYVSAFSPDGGKVISGCSDRTLKLWDFASDHEVEYWGGRSDYVAAADYVLQRRDRVVPK